MDEISCLQAVVHGKVQGVGFRYFVMENAQALELTGWTRNRLNRTVEVLAEGEKSDIELFLEKLRLGPRVSSVKKIDVEWLTPLNQYDKFSIRMTR
ncbi:MAG: acylphosphatase [Chloroflexota bacterium]